MQGAAAILGPQNRTQGRCDVPLILTRLTIASLVYIAKNGGQVNMLVVDGSSQVLTTHHIVTILGISWGTFITSWIANAVYYQVREMSSNEC